MAYGDPDDGNPFTGAFANIQNYLRGRWPGGGSALAATVPGSSVTQAPNPLTTPTPVDPRLTGGGPPVPSSVNVGAPPMYSTLAPTTQNGLPTSQSGFGVQSPMPPMPYAGGQGPVSGPTGAGVLPQLSNAPPNTVMGWQTPQGGGDMVANAPYYGAPAGTPSATPPAGARQPSQQRGRIPASAQAHVPPGATPNDRFQAIQYGTAQRGPGSTPYITALNLGGLFGGGGANPANVPSANATPMSGGVLAKGSNLSKAPWSYGPLQKGKVFPSEMGPFTPDQIAARSLKQRYG